jgi:glycosyltransferase involved in cell wall biosynthesis
MHVTALVESPEHVCCRYRIAAFRPFLEAAGHSLTVCSLPRRWWDRLRLFRDLRGATVVLQRRLLPIWQFMYMRRSIRRLFFDFDDAVFLRDSYSPRGLYHAGRMRRFATVVRLSDAVLAGNTFLYAKAAALADRSRVHLLPTCVDPQGYSPGKPGQGRGPVQLVWVGSSSTLQGLERHAALLDEVGSRVAGIRLKLICDRTLSLLHLAVDYSPWSEATEAAEIASADIGVSLIPDDDWSRGKCGLKVLQYMAAGLPVVANPVGVHSAMVRHGETGFLAETAAEWADAIGKLSADPALRQRMGRAGRALVEERYNVSVGARIWLDVLGSVQSSPARTA